MKLYSYWRSSCAYRTRIAVGLKDIDCQIIPIQLSTGENRQASYLAQNPIGQVPLLEFDDGGTTRRIGQSAAIIEYLEETVPQPPLLPTTATHSGDIAYLRAKTRQLVEVINSGVQPMQNMSMRRYVREELSGDDETWCRYWVERGLRAFETMLEDTHGRYCVGDQVTMADLYLIPQIRSAREFAIDLTTMPTIVDIESACQELEAFQRAQPEKQPDFGS